MILCNSTSVSVRNVVLMTVWEHWRTAVRFQMCTAWPPVCDVRQGSLERDRFVCFPGSQLVTAAIQPHERCLILKHIWGLVAETNSEIRPTIIKLIVWDAGDPEAWQLPVTNIINKGFRRSNYNQSQRGTHSRWDLTAALLLGAILDPVIGGDSFVGHERRQNPPH